MFKCPRTIPGPRLGVRGRPGTKKYRGGRKVLVGFLDSECLKELSADFCPLLPKIKKISHQLSHVSSSLLQQTSSHLFYESPQVFLFHPSARDSYLHSRCQPFSTMYPPSEKLPLIELVPSTLHVTLCTIYIYTHFIGETRGSEITSPKDTKLSLSLSGSYLLCHPGFCPHSCHPVGPSVGPFVFSPSKSDTSQGSS